LPPIVDPRLLTDPRVAEDGAVYLLDEDRAIIFTTDFFTPIVDDPETFGAIAAANALSDVYAMGGVPRLALALASYPAKKYGIEGLASIAKGAVKTCTEAGCLMVGGHSIEDEEPKYGLAVVGEVHPTQMLSKGGARPGEILILTKPLGTGILSTALKKGELAPSELETMVNSMTQLNALGAQAAQKVEALGATDVTGFGLLGHALEMAQSSKVAMVLEQDQIPTLPGVESHLEKGHIPGGTRRNLEDVRSSLVMDEEYSEDALLLLADAQTNGGLLVAVAPERVQEFQAVCPKGVPIGRVEEAPRGKVILRKTHRT